MAARRVDLNPCYVLHTYPYKETSLIVEAISSEHGRVALLAKGARRPRSALRGMLLAFFPLRLSWSGSGELATLLNAEWQGGAVPLKGQALICAFYLNELLLRLLPRNDPHEALYDAYAIALQRLSGAEHLSVVLRNFEKKLLEELGYAMVLIREAGGDIPVQPECRYLYDPESGPMKMALPHPDASLTVSGQTLLDIAREDFSRAETREESMLLMRNLIGHRLGERPLHSRTILRELQEL